jgi:foldase protein PrsA
LKQITSNKYFIPGFALVVFIIVALILVVFRGGVPSDAVAKVSGTSIPVAKFNKTLVSYTSQTAGASGKGVVPDPPNYTKCIAAKKSGSKKLSDGALKKQCQTEWNTAKTQIMTALVQQEWYVQEAKDRGITITPAQVQARFLPLKQQSFPKEADYQKFLKSSGQTQADILALVKASMVQEKVQAVAATAPTPTTGQVEKEYNDNKKQYATPASRDLSLVFNSSKAKADAAKAELEGGADFASVAKKYSQDSASKATGGKFPGVTKGQFPKPLDGEVFAAKKGALVGPIKTQYGYYVFQVTKIKPGSQQSLKQASPQILQALKSEAQTKISTNFQTEFTDKWRKKTKCADLYKVPAVCGNTPKPKGGSTATTGAASQ